MKTILSFRRIVPGLSLFSAEDLRTFACALGFTACLVAAAAASADTIAIVGGTVHPVTGDPFVGNVIVTDGLIVAAGPSATVPAGAETIDATSLNVYPGLMDAMSQVGMIEVSSVTATDDRAEMGMYNPHLEAATAIHPSSELINVTRANGITHGMIAPRSSRDGVIAGRTTVVHLDGWTVEEMTIQASRAMVIAWPEVQTRRFDFATFSFKESAFNEAKDEAKEKQDELRDWIDASRQYNQAMHVERPRAVRDLKLSYLSQCLDGGMPVILQANSKRDIEACVAFAEEQGFDMILAGGRDAWMIADLLAEKDIPVILSATQAMPREQDDPYDRPYRNPGVLADAGVKIGFGSGATGGWGSSAHSARLLPYEAAMAAGYGLSEEDALKALTIWPAEILGVEDELGSIEPGKIANLIVVDGNPLELESNVEYLIIDGRSIGTENFHRRLYEKYRSRS